LYIPVFEDNLHNDQSIMPKLIALFLIGVFIASTGVLLPSVAVAQTAQVSGKIADTAEKKNLANSSVLLLRKSDSVLVRHTRSNSSGDFQLSKLPGGHYLILVTYPGYADYVDTLDVDSAAAVKIPTIGMVLKSTLLQAVVVNGSKGGMRIKGTRLNSPPIAFMSMQGATVEDLLKRLPGIQVDRNGQITAEGEDSKERCWWMGRSFLATIPTLVTQNLRADMVDKVQVYDKKSDQADLHGDR
jgi:hypothetical protein